MASVVELTQQLVGMQQMIQDLRGRLAAAELQLRGQPPPAGPAQQPPLPQQPYTPQIMQVKYLWPNEYKDGASWLDWGGDEFMLYVSSVNKPAALGLKYAAYSKDVITDAKTPAHLKECSEHA